MSNSENIDNINIVDQMDVDEEFIEEDIEIKDADASNEAIKFLEIDNLPDINQIVDIYPKIISYQFPILTLLDQQKIKSENDKKTTTTGDINVSFMDYLNENKSENLNTMFTFQPFTEQFQENFENYLQPQYEKIGQQLYIALVKQCNLWKHLKALSGMYFMLQGESMHQLCDAIFDRVCL